MTQQECLEKSGNAYGVIEPDGEAVTWYSDWFSAELARYQVIKSPERVAELKAIRGAALTKAREVRAAKRAEIERKKVELCKCGYTVSMCACEAVTA